MIIDFFESYSLNIFSIIMLLILLISMIQKKEIYRFSSRLIMWVIISLGTLLILEIITWTLDGVDTPMAFIFNHVFNFLFFTFSGIIVGFFGSYVDYLIYGSMERIVKRFYYMHGFVVLIILGVINFFTPLLYSIDDNNIFSREPFILLGIMIVGIMMFYFLILIYINKSKLHKKTIISVFIFLMLPFITGIFQMLIYGLLLMWSGLALGVLTAYIFTEMISTSKDYLTRLYTRGTIVEYVDRMIQKKNEFSLIMIDLDDFKIVNDTLGHEEGDKVLVHFSKVLLNTVSSKSIVSRFGGDEFVIAVPIGKKEDVDNLILEIEQELLQYEEYELMKKIKFSAGYYIKKPDKEFTIDEILYEADMKMYEVKASHKNFKRRKTDGIE